MSPSANREVVIRTHKGTGQRRVTREDLVRVVHLSQSGAATALNIGVTRFKTVCRQLGFSSWPYRKVKSIRNLEKTIKAEIPPEQATPILEELKRLFNKLLDEPSLPLDEEFKKLRQAAYKKTHGKRKYSDIDDDDEFSDSDDDETD